VDRPLPQIRNEPEATQEAIDSPPGLAISSMRLTPTKTVIKLTVAYDANGSPNIIRLRVQPDWTLQEVTQRLADACALPPQHSFRLQFEHEHGVVEIFTDMENVREVFQDTHAKGRWVFRSVRGPEGQTPASQEAKILKELKELRFIVQTKLESSSKKEETDIGKSVLDYLKRNQLITTFVPSEGESVLQLEEYSMLQDKNEKELTEYMLSKLGDILKPRAVVSSENHRWLMTGSNRFQEKQKPDAFVTHHATFVRKTSSRSVVCGVPAHRAFYQGLGIIDFKVIATNDAFGELVVHIEHLYANIRANNPADNLASIKCALASREGIWLVTFSGSTPMNMIKMKWTDTGSAGMLRSFFCEENRTSLILDELLKLLTMKAISFLGAGGTGCVFKVSPVDESRPMRSRCKALKVVVDEKKIASLHNEHQLNRSIFAIHSNVAVVKAEDFKACCDGIGAGMLMEESGTGAHIKTSRGKMKINIKRALDALASIHSTGYHHGDARIANLLICSDVYKWCDLQYAYCQEGEALKKSSFGKDIITLMTSLSREFPFESKEFMGISDGYVKTNDTNDLLHFFCQGGVYELESQVAEISHDELE
jgi:hypothetical protein